MSARIWLNTSASNNFIQGNYIGTDITGINSLANNNDGVYALASGNIIGGSVPGAGNLISGNKGWGLSIPQGESRNLVQGNRIGTNAAGTSALANDSGGIDVRGHDNVIGGAEQGTANVISGNHGPGIYINYYDATYNSVTGNFIGTAADGVSPLGNQSHGIYLTQGKNIIGKSISGASNIIAFNGGDGVYVESSTGNSIRGNSIFANTGLGIDLGTNGVTPNDTGDGDTGANNLCNFPVLTSATLAGTETTVAGTLNSVANAVFVLDFFANDTADPSGYGEGRTYVGSATVYTNGSGNASFTVPFSNRVPVNHYITATSTDPSGSTSEFSLAKKVVLGPGEINSGLADDLIRIRRNPRDSTKADVFINNSGPTHGVLVSWSSGHRARTCNLRFRSLE